MKMIGDQRSTARKARTLMWFVVPLCLGLQLSASNVVTDWNGIASITIVTTGAKPAPAATVWFAYSSLAVYDAVNAITGQYQPFYYKVAGPPNASVDAAAVAAAHRVLVHYFPAQQATLDTQFQTSLAAIMGDPNATTAGVAVGEASATALINARVGDGLEANVSYTPGSGPGAWVPTPPNFPNPVTPWLAQMRPFTMRAAGDFLPDPPPALTSETWARDYNLTRLYGGTTSTARSDAEGRSRSFGPINQQRSTREPSTIWSRTTISVQPIRRA